mmetsp:Transcript_47285/g.102674  ORF Transcript_47285/g.102674 Transcript_47285/m.102674 type:complete len:96 (-) Transcript_47285:545-832(-)
MQIPYCVKLMQRSAQLYATTGHLFSVMCSDFTDSLPPTFDYITWWQEPSQLQNAEVFAQLQTMHIARPFQSDSQALVLFDLKYWFDIQDSRHYKR